MTAAAPGIHMIMECEVSVISSVTNYILDEKLEDNLSSTYGSSKSTHLAQVFEITKYFSQAKVVFNLLLVSQFALTYATG